MAVIEIGNVASRLRDEGPGTMAAVRRSVAYQDMVLPTVEAQQLIKAFFRKAVRLGGAADVAQVWMNRTLADQLEYAGLSREDLTPVMLGHVLRQRGHWDGWKRMVNRAGVFPTGLLTNVVRAVKLHGREVCELRDNREVPVPFSRHAHPIPPIPLFGYQQEAVDAFVSATRGVIDLPPRSGKTRIAMSAIARLGVPTLYMVPGVGLAKQTAAAFHEFYEPWQVQSVTGGQRTRKNLMALQRALVWVTTPQTAAKLPNLHTREALVIDEFHHAAASTWQAACDALPNAYYRLGLTGTHYRADGKDMEMCAILGRAAFRRSVSDMVGLKRLVPARIVMLRVRGTCNPATSHDVYPDGVVHYPERNRVAAGAARALIAQGKRVLVLVKQIAHGEKLTETIPGAVFVSGKDNDEVDIRLKQLAEGRIRCVVGTSVIGEGRDVPAADALVYAAGGKSRVKVKQDYFRVLTASPGKAEGIVVDMADLHHERLTEHAAHRLRLYRSEGCFKVEIMEPEAFIGGA